ncbi:hypothetical protein CGJ31_24250, partial [Vibrio parahaemolyticus]|uniref:hypothetical protein n=1 Tax=Vibrio parahaemolyticus TaxID=670 RepID=UPI001167C2F1
INEVTFIHKITLSDRIEDVENKKRARELDRLIAKKTLRLYRQNGKYSTDKQIKNTTEKIRLHLNVLIVSIALSKTKEEAINLANAHKILGRHVLGKKVKKLPDDTVLEIKE